MPYRRDNTRTGQRCQSLTSAMEHPTPSVLHVSNWTSFTTLWVASRQNAEGSAFALICATAKRRRNDLGRRHAAKYLFAAFRVRRRRADFTRLRGPQIL